MTVFDRIRDLAPARLGIGLGIAMLATMGLACRPEASADGPAAVSAPAASPASPSASDSVDAFARALAHRGPDGLDRHSVLDEVADWLANRGLDRAADQTAMALVASRLRAGGYDAAAWTAGTWRSSDPTDAAPDRAESVLDLWQRQQKRFWRDLERGRERGGGEDDGWHHVGVGVASSPRDGAAFAVILARDARVERAAALAPLRDDEAVARAVLDAANAARRRERLPALEGDSALDAVARAHAEDMLARGYFDHRAPDGTTPMRRLEAAGLRYRAVAENIAKGHFTPEEVVERWLDSPGHRRNILAPGRWRHGAGVAIHDAGKATEVVWVEVFAR